MLTEHVDEAVRHLCGARRGPPLHELPPGCRPQTDADAYQIQEAVALQLGETVGGWKVGAASAAGAAFCAPIWMRMIRPSPASYLAAELRIIGIEAEIAFRLGRDLPARTAAYDRAEVIAGAALHPVIEVVDSRYADFRALDRLSILADNFSNGGLVYGPAVQDWEKLDLASTAIMVTEDGEPFAGSSAGAARDPIAALVDFANLMNGRGGVKAGTLVTTGSWTGMVFTRRGAQIVADFGPLGRVEVAFPADE
ncbi:MAG: fumarylacetoacetate hydrolase family protein [Alphaproteobacteria bacterium]|nr:fumarylacetoacetate hydrolase family protein [Alphaproteobacteria bacterium]MBV9376496.1 fumarylacetoacetate hydrolase family protein [Alphaproteobacteria bacterium]